MLKKILIFLKKWWWVILALVVVLITWKKLREGKSVPRYKATKKKLLNNIEHAEKEYWRLENEKKTADDFKDYSRSDLYKFIRSTL